MKNHFLFYGAILVLMTLILIYCKREQTEVPKNDIEKVIEYARSPNADPTKVFEIEAYYWNENEPILITDLNLLNVNSILPRESYIRLSGAVLQALEGKSGYEGALLRFKGTVSYQFIQGEGEVIDFICPELPILVQPVKPDIKIPVRLSICDQYPSICATFHEFPVTYKFALLYSGGFDFANAHRRYWNDLDFMRSVLINQYGYSEENIVIVYRDGIGHNGELTVDYPATQQGLSSAISYLANRMTSNDDLFVFATNHGGGRHRGDCHQDQCNNINLGVVDTNIDENEGANGTDEVMYYYNQVSNFFTDDEFSNLIANIPHKNLIAVLEPCFSGGLLKDLSGSNNVVISACQDNEFSYGGVINGIEFDIFSYYFTEALNRKTVTGSSLNTNPDENGDNAISMLEAFRYAVMKDNYNETPMLEADGNGVGLASPTVGDTDGLKASLFFL